MAAACAGPRRRDVRGLCTALGGWRDGMGWAAAVGTRISMTVIGLSRAAAFLLWAAESARTLK
jgi:hypothetical protein